MEATVAAPVPTQPNALSAQTSSPNKNTASQPPPKNIITLDSLEKAIAPTPPKDNATAAQNRLERAISSPQVSSKNFVTQTSLENAVGNHVYKPKELTTVPATMSPFHIPVSQPKNSVVQNSVNIKFAQSAITNIPGQPATAGLIKTTVTAQGTWQNMATPLGPEQTLPAVQNFLQMAFETVQRSNHSAMTAAMNSLQSAINQPTPLLAAAMIQRPMLPFVSTPVSPQPSLPAPFRSLQRSTSQPFPIETPKPQSVSLPDKTKTNLSESTNTLASTSVESKPSTSEVKKSSSQTEMLSKGQSYPGYTFYNTRLTNSKQTPSPKRSILVAKRHNSEDKTISETGNSAQNATTEKLAQLNSPKIAEQPQLSSSEKKNTDEGPRDSPVKQNSSRVAQTFKEFKERSLNGPQPQKGGQKVQATAGGFRGWRRHKQPEGEEVEEIDPKKRVLVSGFPAYTHSQDLIRVLSRFGICQVDSCRNRLAVVTFDREADAKSAIRGADDINIYGEFVEITPYTNPRHVSELYKAYKKVISTQKDVDITMPDQIDLSGDFQQQLDNVQAAIRLSREQAQAVASLYVDLERVLQKEWPGCVAIPFGSIPTGLGIKSSDADCYVELPAALRARGAAGGASAFVIRTRRLLQFYPKVFTHLVAIPRANTPIVKFRHAPSGFHCDVSAKTPLGAQNSKLIKLLLDHDSRLSHVAIAIKYWAKIHELSGTGRLTNYALTMMVIFYFQQPSVGLVPAVEKLQRDHSTRYIVDQWNAGFSPRKIPGPTNTASLPELLGGFFEFYAAFDFDKMVICPYLGTAILKSAFDSPNTLPQEFARYVSNVRDNLASPMRHGTPFCVQDPFEQSHNVASSVCAKLAAEIRAFFKFAADAYIADRDNGYKNFLRTILLTRPKIKPERVTPSTNVALIPRIRGHITAADWRATLREIILDMIFKKILKLELKKNDDDDDKKERGRRRFDRERYTGTANKPVWRRKRASNVTPPAGPEQLVAQQAAFTYGILAAPNVAFLEFELELWFREEPRNCSLGFKMLEGDMDAFRQFVTFLHTFMMDWFRVLLTPHLAPLKEDSSETVRADAAERAAARSECTIKFEREPPRPSSPPRLVLDPAEITQKLDAVTLDTDTENSSDSSKKEDR